jgi:adenosylcobinamide-phosphate synthase
MPAHEGLSSPLLALALALLVDGVAGDPPSPAHPVAWLGRLIACGRRALCAGSPTRLVMAGAALTIAVAAGAAAAGALLAMLARAAGGPGVVLEALALTTMLSLRDLARAARGVQAALRRGDLDGARAAVGRDLVSRPTALLGPGQVAAAAIESVAENLTDSVIAPVAFYLVFGLPGAFAYRAVNTADAMIGYRQGALEHFGKVAARLDDALNFVPARLAALAIAAGAATAGGDTRGAWKTMRAQHGRTASPNAGWTMAAMAGALGVRLEKPGHYVLGAGAEPIAEDISTAVRIMTVAAGMSITAMALCAVLLRTISS